MKLIVQIPCLNEEETLPYTVKDIPREIPGVDKVEILVIDDGSTDRTSQVARECGVDHIVRFSKNQGLAKGFMAGLQTALSLGADIIVNTDADNQYNGADITNLIKPILDGKADIVIGNRDVGTINHFSPAKKFLQKFGSWVVRVASDTRIPDAPSGFRAFSREAAMRTNIISGYTYTLETIIQAGHNRLAIAHIPVRTNPQTRESRLITSIWRYVWRSASTIIRTYAMYRPLKFFATIGVIIFSAGFIISLRYLFYMFTGQGAGHLQSLILSAVLMMLGFQTIMIGLISDLIAANRRLSEEIVYRLRKSDRE
ncbi:MAG: glycosyl transferase [Nitrospirae bacterium RIFCSPLOW2_12_42_9]|nr:MAG: glycosyl transferase [Nitrospirae bacterium RIFCSPLOWO2_02_42_7]OGW59638.1 MAG: glycosyl transferase [Nitrospirae bacterium RIFCSPHIGHO2_02_FULL_42_12]OGW62443.1 MAG: glycosyl transferase [Nitrospirae bacterium RIFCSPLOW2_12_42_9]HBI24478.1 glycosyl transferase [Nitrospiraceae bacterium]